MSTKAKLKELALKHGKALELYRATLGRIKTKYYFDMQRRTLQKKGLDIIQEISDALTKYNAEFFLDFGTLLGIVRDNHLIKHDRDIDFGIHFTEDFTPEKLDIAMKEIGLKKMYSFLFREEIKETTFKRGIIHIDFFKHEESDAESIHYVFFKDSSIQYAHDKQYSVVRKHNVHIPSTKKWDLNNYSFNVPSNTEEYLESVYTKGWKIPNPQWTYLSKPNPDFVIGEFGEKTKK